MTLRKFSIIIVIILCANIISCNPKTSTEQQDLFVIEINTDDLANVYATTTYIGDDPITVYHDSSLLILAVYDLDGEIYCPVISYGMREAATDFETGDIYRIQIPWFFTGKYTDPAFYLMYDSEDFVPSGYYELVATMTYTMKKNGDDIIELKESVFVEVP